MLRVKMLQDLRRVPRSIALVLVLCGRGDRTGGRWSQRCQKHTNGAQPTTHEEPGLPSPRDHEEVELLKPQAKPGPGSDRACQGT